MERNIRNHMNFYFPGNLEFLFYIRHIDKNNV